MLSSPDTEPPGDTAPFEPPFCWTPPVSMVTPLAGSGVPLVIYNGSRRKCADKKRVVIIIFIKRVFVENVTRAIQKFIFWQHCQDKQA